MVRPAAASGKPFLPDGGRGGRAPARHGPLPLKSMPAMDLVTKALRAGEGRKFKAYQKRAEAINRYEPEMEALSDEELRAEADSLRERARDGESLDELLPEAFALTREASRRTTGQRHYDVQMIGGMVLNDGAI